MYEDLEIIHNKCSVCTKCPLHKTKHHTVFSDGVPNPKLMLIGEAPGYNEDMQGKPFVGKAGQLLDKIFASVGLTRKEHVYICNTIKCRPPENRDPKPEEMAACRPFLESELQGRQLVVGLGRSAIRDLMGYDGKMSEVVNRITEIQVGAVRVKFLPTYHPAATIYNRESRAALKDAMRIVKDFL